jgi:hypothetical protein
MGFTPQQVNAMSMWQYLAVIEGYAAANSQDDGKMSDKEADDLFAWTQAMDDRAAG